MDVTALETLTWQKINDAGGTYAPNCIGALNEAQRFFTLLTLCLETKATLALAANALFLRLLPQLPDFIRMQRVYNSTGEQLRPATIAELEALDSDWQNTSGTPERYAHLGLDALLLYPQPPAADSLTVVYACAPAPLASGTDVPAIRMASHYALALYAAWALRQPEGAQEFAKVSGYLDEFMAEADKVAEIIRRRNAESGAQAMPFELARTKQS